MIDRPILFSTPMVQAILTGSKTMTRRVVSKNNSHCGSMPFNALDLSRAISTISFGNQSILKAPVIDDDGTLHRVWPKWETCVRLWVRETWSYHDPIFDDDKAESFRVSALVDPASIIYKADSPDYLKHRWRPSIFMPRWASRITLEIINVRVERLQEITEEDALKEGIPSNYASYSNSFQIYSEHLKKYLSGNNAKAVFAQLWDSINGKTYPWESNPWVWIIEFKIIKTNASEKRFAGAGKVMEGE